jgi:hypothetical protein
MGKRNIQAISCIESLFSFTGYFILKTTRMNCCQFPAVLLFIGSLLVISCGKTQPEPAADFPTDPGTFKISGDVCLINLSQDAKSHKLTFGDGTAFTKTEEVPTQASQIQEKL